MPHVRPIDKQQPIVGLRMIGGWLTPKQWHKYLYPAIKSSDGVFEDLNDEDAGLGAAAGDPDAEVLARLPLKSHREEIFKKDW